MSKRNGYKIQVTDNLEEIVNALETTDIVVEVSEPIQGQDTRTITAEDAPRAGEAFSDYEKDPGRYIFWKEIKRTLKPYTNSIEKVRHTLSDDTGCFTKVTDYETRSDNFVEVNYEKDEGRIR